MPVVYNAEKKKLKLAEVALKTKRKKDRACWPLKGLDNMSIERDRPTSARGPYLYKRRCFLKNYDPF